MMLDRGSAVTAASSSGERAGLVVVDLPEGELPWRGNTDEAVLRRRAQYVAGIEYVAQTFGAEQPLQWKDDAAMLVLREPVPMELPGLVYRVARELWQRVRMDLALKVKVTAHVGRILPGAEKGAPAGEDVDVCQALFSIAPVNGITMTEDLALALPEAQRRDVALLGRAERDERHIYFYPASGAPAALGRFILDDPERMWSRFREYARSPDVRLIRYVGFRLHKKEPPRLDVRDVFVPSEVEIRPREARIPTAIQPDIQAMAAPWRRMEQAAAAGETLSISEALMRHRSVVVLGDPGAGKTTLLRWLAVLASSGSYALEARVGLAERLLPIPVSVGRLAELRRDLGGDGVSLPDALTRYFHDRSLGQEEQLRALLIRELERGRCLLLLDGLDEVKGEEREAIRSWIEAFAATHPTNRFVATSRVYGYAGLDLPDGVEVVLRPFTDEQVETYVRGFHRAYVLWETGQAPSGNGAEQLLEALRASERLSSMARNPFMLSAFALIHRAEGRLPRHRVQAYQMFARALCETWADARRLVAGSARGAVIEYDEEALPILGDVALEMHEQHPTGVAPAEFVIKQLASALVQHRDIARGEAERAAREFLRRASEDVQILLERGAGTWGFLHLTFQEFFVAAGLHAAERFEEVAMLHLFDPRWEEVLRLGVGYMALVQNRPKAAERFLKRVLEYEAPEPGRWVTKVLGKQIPLAALLAAEAGDALPVALQKAVAEASAEWVKTAPERIADRYLDELSFTDFAGRLAVAISPMTTDPNGKLRTIGARSLGRLRHSEAAGALLALFADEESGVRKAAASAFGMLTIADPVDRLSSVYEGATRDVRATVLMSLNKSTSRLAHRLVLRGLADDDENVRAAAVGALRWWPPEESSDMIVAAAKDATPSVRAQVAEVFGEVRNLEGLMAMLGDPAQSVRNVALAAIHKGFPDAGSRVSSVVAPLMCDDDPTVRQRAELMVARSLLKLPVHERVELFRSDLAALRAAALRSLVGETEVDQLWLEALDDASERVRAAAKAWALSSMTRRMSIDVLRAALAKQDPLVRAVVGFMVLMANEYVECVGDDLVSDALNAVVDGLRVDDDEVVMLSSLALAVAGGSVDSELIWDALRAATGFRLAMIAPILCARSRRDVAGLLRRLEREQGRSDDGMLLWLILWRLDDASRVDNVK